MTHGDGIEQQRKVRRCLAVGSGQWLGGAVSGENHLGVAASIHTLCIEVRISLICCLGPYLADFQLGLFEVLFPLALLLRARSH